MGAVRQRRQPQPERALPPLVVRPVQKRKLSPLPLMVILMLSAVVGVSLLSGITLAGVYFYYQSSGRIYPRVFVANKDLGGNTLEEAAVLLHQEWNLEPSLMVSNGIQSQYLSPNELGISLNALATAQRAHEIGHGGMIVDEFMQLLVCLLDGWEVQPIMTFDEQQARLGLENLSPQFSLPAQNARLVIEGENITTRPAELGYTVNLESTLQRLKANPLEVMRKGFFLVDLQPVPAEVEDVSALVKEAERLLNTPININAYDPVTDTWYNFALQKSDLAGMLTVTSQNQNPVLSLDKEQALTLLKSYNANLPAGSYLEATENAKALVQAIPQGKSATILVRHHPTTYTVKPGDTLLKIGWNLGIPYWMILDANPGIDPDNVWAGAQLVIPSKDELLPLPIVFGKRIRISISKQRLWVYENGEQIGKYIISTGIDRSPTQPGVFQVQTHEKMAYASVWDLYMPDFIGIYEAWPGFMNGIHGLPTLSNGQRLWANILGKPASYGCIIMDLRPAEWLYNWAENGVVVEIVP